MTGGRKNQIPAPAGGHNRSRAPSDAGHNPQPTAGCASLAGPLAGTGEARLFQTAMILDRAQNIEAAVYFCCLEALQNIAKYAAASHVRICVAARDHSLSFTVSDDGAGYDASRTPMGSGQRNMADRLAALDGRLEVRSVPSEGTTITAHLPLPTVPAES